MGSLMEDLELINKNNIIDLKGTKYMDFRKLLSPIYWMVYRDIVFGYIGLISVTLLIIMMQNNMPGLFFLTIIIGGLLFGYTIAYIQLFFHEAAHFNISKNRKFNDLLANVLIGWFAGQQVAHYRVIHWEHHRHLGETADTENTYFDPLNIKFVAESITGIKAIKVFLSRKKHLAKSQNRKSIKDCSMFILGVIVHLAIITGALITGYWQLSLAWISGVIMFYPFFGALRTLLEHRDYSADPKVDYHTINHGKVTRLFKKGIIGSTFGGAGFHRHLLHHWDPLIPYTQLNRVESFLLNTDLEAVIKASTTDYITAFITFLRKSKQ